MVISESTFSDKLMLALSFFGATFIAVLIWREDLLLRYFIPAQRGTSEIGEILQVKNDARRRMRESLTWYPAQSNEILFENDSLFTGDQSEIEFKLNSVGGISVNPNSLIVLLTENQETIFNLKLGSIRVKTRANKAIKIRQANGKVSSVLSRADGVSLLIEQDSKGELKIQSAEENVSVEVNGVLAHVKKTAEVVTSVPETKSAIVELPPVAKVTTQPEPLNEPKENLPDVVPAFKKIVKPRKEPSPAIVVAQLPEAIKLAIPALVAPPDKTILVSFDANTADPIIFAWKKTEDAKTYELQFSTDLNFSKILKTANIPSSQFILKEKISNGFVYWRVRSISGETKSDWSKERSVEYRNKN